MRAVPRGDLVLPAQERPSQGAHLDRAGLVLEVTAQPLDEGDGQAGIVVLVYGANDLLGVPGGADLATGITGVEQSEQLGSAVVVEALVGSSEQSHRYSGSFLWPRCPIVSFCTRRRHSSSLELASFIR